MAKHVVLGPFGEPDLSDQFGLDPMNSSTVRRLAFLKGRVGLFKALKRRKSKSISRVKPVPTLPA
jgi:hypothetical protein